MAKLGRTSGHQSMQRTKGGTEQVLKHSLRTSGSERIALRGPWPVRIS